jgi:hypothetical protein
MTTNIIDGAITKELKPTMSASVVYICSCPDFVTLALVAIYTRTPMKRRVDRYTSYHKAANAILPCLAMTTQMPKFGASEKATTRVIPTNEQILSSHKTTHSISETIITTLNKPRTSPR